MKKISILFALIITLASVDIACAQSKDVLNQTKKKSKSEWNTESEEVISKKKKQTQTVSSSDFDTPFEEAPQADGPVISTSCEETMSVEFVSLVGYKASQKVYITIRYTNHDVNKYVRINNFKAYNEDGEEFTAYIYEGNEAITDVPVKKKWEVGAMLPSENSKLTIVSFSISDCAVEMRNVPIEWK